MSRSSHPSRHVLPGVVVPAQLDYAIRGVVSLASAGDTFTKVDVIATEHGLSAKFLAQILVLLRNVGIVDTHRGSEGGYRLARDPDRIRVLDVFTALSPLSEPATVQTNGHGPAARTSGAWELIGESVRTALGGLTVADLVGTPAPALAVPEGPVPTH